MKTWVMVWFLVYPANDDGSVHWESGVTKSMTESECYHEVVEKDLQYTLLLEEKSLTGFTLYCKDRRGTKVPVEQRMLRKDL